MSLYNDVLCGENEFAYGYGNGGYEEGQTSCPVCGGAEWDFLLRDCHGEIIGCEDCVSKLYMDELYSEY